MAQPKMDHEKSSQDVSDSVETIQISDEDAAFVLGKGGKTKNKIVLVSGCDVELLQDELILEFRGTSKQRRLAMKYARCVMAQRQGVVHVTEDEVAEDCTIVKVPQEAIGFVTGKGGVFLRTMEDEHSVLMCFAEIRGAPRSPDCESLLIFGGRRGRRSAQLAIMSAVENKVPECYTKGFHDTGETYDVKTDLVGDWGTETMELEGEELSYAIGKGGGTRRKLARSSGCVVQYVSHVVFMSGTAKQRKYAKEYLQWLFQQLDGPLYVDTTGRDDCTIVEVPKDCVGYVTGSHREALGAVEELFGTLMFFMGKKDPDREEDEIEQLAILGHHRARRGAELSVMSAVEKKNPGFFTTRLSDREATTTGFDTDRITLSAEDVSYALGKEGATRKKIGVASNAIFQFVGNIAFVAGDLSERRRCRDYLGWLLEQKDGHVVCEVGGRDDVTEVEVSDGAAGVLYRDKGYELRWIEQETGTFCFMADDPDGSSRLLVCGHEGGSVYSNTGRVKAERLLRSLLQRDSWHEGNSQGTWRKRSRSPRRYWSHQSWYGASRSESTKGQHWSSQDWKRGDRSQEHRGEERRASRWKDSRGSALAALPRLPRSSRSSQARSVTPPWRTKR